MSPRYSMVTILRPWLPRLGAVVLWLAMPGLRPPCALADEPVQVQDTAAEEAIVKEAVDASALDNSPGVPLQLDLEGAQRIALEQNPSLFAAAARIEQARDRVRQARSLFLPQVTATYAASRTHLDGNTVRAAKDQALATPLVSSLSGSVPQTLFNPSQGGGIAGVGIATLAGLYSGISARSAFDEDIESYSATLTASYIIFDGFSRYFTNAMARFGREETEAAHREVTRLILDAVAQSYFGVQLARENVAIAVADEAFNERQLKEARLRRERGTGSKSDVLNFEVALRAAQSARIQAEGEEAIARVALAALMGLPEAKLGDEIVLAALPEETPEAMAPPDVENLLDAAGTMRPDLQQSALQVARLRAQVGERRSAYYPKVNAFASQRAATSDSSRFGDDDFAGTVGVNVSYDLFAGGRNRATVAEARHQLDEAEWLLEEARLGMAREVRQGAVDLKTAQETLVLQRTTAEYVNENRTLVEKEYRAGQGSLVRLNQAQRDLVAAQARLAVARVALYSAKHALDTATGETISRFEGYIPDGEGVSR